MDVACSLEDVARVLADNGYSITDDACCFPNVADIPSVLSALDSPHSFPESPCSDEDIARVLDIAQMPNPSLLGSCTSGITNFQFHLPSPVEESRFDININKTRDPCITNAVLQNSYLPNFPSRDAQSLDLFSIALNCSFNDDTTHFNALPKENDAFNNYFNSSSALSPVSETETILPGCSDILANQSSQQIVSHNDFGTQVESNSEQQITSDFTPSNKNAGVDTINNLEICPAKHSKVTTTQTKRKRRRKSNQSTPKSKRRKNDTVPKPKPIPDLSESKDNTDANTKPTDQIYPNIAEANTKRQCKNSGTRKPRKTKNDKIAKETTVNIQQETATHENPDSKNVISSMHSEPTQTTATTTEIGSTNGVVEQPKGLRRSSRSTKNTENYNFRLSSLVKRVETERKQQEPKQPKGKAKPPPLSKYRRRTANARERDRMKEINDAFDHLQAALPEMEPEESKQKTTKFTILKLALNYISSLQDILGYDSSQVNSMNFTDDSSPEQEQEQEQQPSSSRTGFFTEDSNNINIPGVPENNMKSGDNNNTLNMDDDNNRTDKKMNQAL